MADIKIIDILMVLRPQLAEAAMRAITQFDWTATGPDGGACGDIAKAMKHIIEKHNIKVKYDYIDTSDIFESEPFHTRLKVTDPYTKEKIIVDLPTHYYERLTDAGRSNDFNKPAWELINSNITPHMIKVEEEEIFDF